MFLKTYEEAKCEVNPCTFDWVKTDLATVKSSSLDFDNGDYVLTLTGTNFGATPTNTEVIIDEVEQTILSASDTYIKV